MGKKSKRNRGASKKLHSEGAQQGGVTNTSASSDVAAAAAAVGNEIDPRSSSSASAGSIRIDPIGSLIQLVEKEDFEGILKQESKLILRATALEGTEPQNAGCIYLVIADALIATHAIPENSRGNQRELHALPSQLGRIAQQAEARMLILSHRMNRTKGRESQTRAHIEEHYDGYVLFANDMECWGL